MQTLVLAGCWARGRGWLGTCYPISRALDPTPLRTSSSFTAPAGKEPRNQGACPPEPTALLDIPCSPDPSSPWELPGAAPHAPGSPGSACPRGREGKRTFVWKCVCSPTPPPPCRWETSSHSNPPVLRGADQHIQVQVAQTHFQPERVCSQVLSTWVSHVDGSYGFFETSQDGRPSLQAALPSTLPPAWSSTAPGPEQVTPFMTAAQRKSWASPGTAGVGQVRLA